MTEPILNTHNKEEYAPAHTAEHLQSMTYEEYIAQQQQAVAFGTWVARTESQIH